MLRLELDDSLLNQPFDLNKHQRRIRSAAAGQIFGSLDRNEDGIALLFRIALRRADATGVGAAQWWPPRQGRTLAEQACSLGHQIIGLPVAAVPRDKVA